MPDDATRRQWTETDDAFATSLPHDVWEGEDGRVEVRGWTGEVELRARVSPDDAALLLDGLELPAFQIVSPPRARDDRQRGEEILADQLADLADGARAAVTEWMGRVADLSVALDLQAVD